MRVAATLLLLTFAFAPGATADDKKSPIKVPSVKSLLPRIDSVLERISGRPLRSDRNTAWVVMHAAMAFEEDVEIFDAGADESIGGIDYLLTRARWDGKRIFRDDDGEPALPTRNLSYGMTESFQVQDHVDQLLMTLADAGVAPERVILAEGGRRFTVADMVAAAKRNFRPDQELGWTLVALSVYLEPRATWTNARGESFALTSLLDLAMRRDPRYETEGGPHHLYGVAYAAKTLPLSDAFRVRAESYLRRYADIARSWQHADGAFSAGGFRKPVAPRDARRLVSTTGHTLEWLAVALPPAELKEPWVVRAVDRLLVEMENNPPESFTDGGSYHAAHALRLFKESLQ